jgi:glucosamine-6-phosphate deaminase
MRPSAENEQRERLKCVVHPSADIASALAAAELATLIRRNNAAGRPTVLGLATGGTPVGTYKQLVEWYNKGDIDFSEVTTVNLDEYRGLPKEHPESYWSFMHRNLFDHVNIRPEAINLPDGTNMDADAECARYDAVIHNVGGVDLQLLGIGNDGHIGFNEPNEAFELGTHCVDLKEETIEANKRFFDGNADLVPKQAYTMGIKTIMQARKVLMVANGKGKADIVKKAFFGPVTPEVPASILQMHPDFILVGDEEALSEI